VLQKRTRQLSLADTDNWFKKIPETSVWHRLRTWREDNLTDEQFAPMYSNIGRPSVPPTYMMALLVIEMRQGWSDREAVEAAMFDDRVKYALGVSRSPEFTCERSTLCKFRARAMENDMDRKLLGQTMRSAAQAGLLGDDEDLVDSFMVVGAAAKQGTYVLIHQAIRGVLGQMRRDEVSIPELRRADYETHRKATIQWSDAAAREALLQELVADARELVAHCRRRDDLCEELRQRVELLSTVTEQDIETLPDGSVAIAQRVAKERVISTVDSEMRHGRKTTSAKTDGYKCHLMSQNVESGEARIITATAVTPANVADGDVAADLVQERMELTGVAPKQIMGDTAYGSASVQEAVTGVSPGTEVFAPVPPSSNRKGRFAKTDFTIDTEAQTVTCPAGHTVSYQAKRKRTNVKPERVVKMDEEKCKTCPLQAQCVGGKGPRTIRVRADEASIQERRKEQEAPEWQAHYRERSRVEHVNAEMTKHGARDGRYVGKRKTEFQMHICAAAHNMMEIERVRSIQQSPCEPREKCA
jgi:transposase